MDPELVFFIIRSLIRVGTVARDAYEQSVRDQNFQMPDLPFPQLSAGELLQRYFNQVDGIYRQLADPSKNGAMAKYWGPNDLPNPKEPDAVPILLSTAMELQAQDAQKIPTNATASWAYLRSQIESGVTGVLDPWSPQQAPTSPWAHIALALADVALDYVGSNPGVLGVGSNGEALIKVICTNLQNCLDADATNGPQAYFVERLGAAILQAGLKTITENTDLIVADPAAGAVISSVAKPLSDLFAKASADGDFVGQLRWTNIRDTVMPQMVSAGLSALADHQQEILGAPFDPNNTLGYFTKGFLDALAADPVANLGTPQGWLPIYQSMLRAVAAKPNLLVNAGSNDQNAQAIQDLIAGIATKLAAAPFPYNTGDAALGLGQVVVDVLQKDLPARTSDPWVLLVPSALQAVLDGVSKGGGSVASLAQGELTAVIRVILQKVAATPGMIVGNGASTELQTIITTVATAMAQDSKFLISEDGWTQIAAAAASAAAANPGKLFGISSATPEGELAGKLISQLLTKASAGFGTMRSGNVVLFGDTLVQAIEDTISAAAGNAVGAAKNIDQISSLVDRLNKMAADPTKPIGAADWGWLYRNLIADAFDKGSLDLTDDQIRQMLYAHQLSGN
jgi:hypothetical protein